VENGKDPRLAGANNKSMITATRERHGQVRRLLSHAFSARAMAEQQPLMNKYINLFLQQLREHGHGGKTPVDATTWYEWTTFDMIGDLSFGEPFGCLENAQSHPWVESFFDSLGIVPYLQAFCNLPLYSILMPLYLILFLPKNIATKRHISQRFTEETLRKRINLGTARPDFVDAMLKDEGETASTSMYPDHRGLSPFLTNVFPSQRLSDLELRDNATLLVTAGSETTATALAATTYYLGTHPDVLTKLEAEVRSAFRSDQEINVSNVQNLPYMLAVLKETMRIHPPVPISLSRVTPPGGSEIAGTHVAGGVS
jgi:cytochrome P450